MGSYIIVVVSGCVELLLFPSFNSISVVLHGKCGSLWHGPGSEEALSTCKSHTPSLSLSLPLSASPLK